MGRGGRERGERSVDTPPLLAAAGGPEPRIGGQTGRWWGGPPRPVRVRRAPSTAAITITAPDGSYAEVLRRARSSIGAEKLKSLGIEDMRARRGLTGSYVLKIPGPVKEDRESKAEALAAEMRGVFAEDSSVKIGRPRAAVRLRGLDEAVTVEEVIDAIVTRGVARPGEINATITRPANGMGVAWVRRPVRAADDLVKASRIKIGWTNVRVELAATRPSHCFRCWREGHVAARCDSAEDKSRICYRCGTVGQPPHAGQPPAALCAEAGKKADHRTVGARCEWSSGRVLSASSLPQRQRQRQQRPEQQQQQQGASQPLWQDPPPKKQRTPRKGSDRRTSERMETGKAADE